MGVNTPENEANTALWRDYYREPSKNKITVNLKTAKIDPYHAQVAKLMIFDGFL